MVFRGLVWLVCLWLLYGCLVVVDCGDLLMLRVAFAGLPVVVWNLLVLMLRSCGF